MMYIDPTRKENGSYGFGGKDGGGAGGNVLSQNPDNYPAVEPAANGSYLRSGGIVFLILIRQQCTHKLCIAHSTNIELMPY